MKSPAMKEVWEKTMNLIKPPPHLKISQWADKFRFLSTESSSEAGRFETARAIFQKEIMDSINDPSITEVIVMSCSKIGKTEVGLESRSTGRTDNPFGLNYISTFEYIPRNGFNLEKTFHNYFKNFSTYNEKYNTSASEWFSVKNRNTMIKNFRKIGSYYLYKNQLLHTYKYYGKEGYFK